MLAAAGWSRPARRSLSVGCRPQGTDDEHGNCGADVRGHFLHWPSVATWVNRPLALRQLSEERSKCSLPPPATPLCNRHTAVSVDGLVHGNMCSSNEESGVDTVVRDTSWHAPPSVGTWLHPQALSPEPPCSGPQQLWPATPEPSPPASPRAAAGCVGSCAQPVVWMPVPLPLVNEVQQVLCRATFGRPVCCS